MPILLCAVSSLAIAWARGASPLRLGSIHLRWLLLPLLALAVQYLAFIRLESAAAAYAVWVQLTSLGLLLTFLVANLRYRSLAVVAAGATLNLLVVTANGGHMPVRIADIERAGYPDVAATLAATGRFEKSAPLDERTRLPWLADVIHVPLPGRDRMVSLGDLLVAAGTFWFVQEALVIRRPRASQAAG